MIEFIAHNLAPIMFLTVMMMLLLGYPVAFTLAAGGLIFMIVGVELSIFAPQEINLAFSFLGLHPSRTFEIMSNQTLLAIPFFTFMGLILERSRMAEDLLDTIGQLFGPMRGGIGIAVILVGALLGATTGVVAASVIAMGLISLPIMMRYGYDRSVATGTIAASGTLAQIVPPSLVLIVMSDQLGASVGDMYVGALLPAALIIGMYCMYIIALTMVKPQWVPALPPETRTLGDGVLSLVVVTALAVGVYYGTHHFVFSGFEGEPRLVAAATTATVFALALALINRGFELGHISRTALVVGVSIVTHRYLYAGFEDVPRIVSSVTSAILFMLAVTLIDRRFRLGLMNREFRLGLMSRLSEQVIIVLIPPLALIFLVLGTILLGIATPTEGGAMGATGAIILAIIKGRLSLSTLRDALDSTTKLTAFVMFILVGARVFALTFYGINGKVWVEELMLGLPGGETGFLLVVTVLVFILGCFLDFFEIAFVIVPLLVDPANALGIDLIWLGIILGINLQTSFLTPPFGFALFYLRSIAPKKAWDDEVTGERIEGIKTLQIYKGVLPYIAIQFIAILIVIFYPRLVTHYRDDVVDYDLDSVIIELPGGLGAPGASPLDGGDDGGLGLPGGLNLNNDPPTLNIQ